MNLSKNGKIDFQTRCSPTPKLYYRKASATFRGPLRTRFFHSEPKWRRIGQEKSGLEKKKVATTSFKQKSLISEEPGDKELGMEYIVEIVSCSNNNEGEMLSCYDARDSSHTGTEVRGSEPCNNDGNIFDLNDTVENNEDGNVVKFTDVAMGDNYLSLLDSKDGDEDNEVVEAFVTNENTETTGTMMQSPRIFRVRRLQSKGDVINDHMVGILVDAHSKKNEFEEARRLIEDFWSLRKFPLGHNVMVSGFGILFKLGNLREQWIYGKVIPERMSDCSYFLQGLCTNKSCPYRHVNVNPNAPVCEGFLRGYCASAFAEDSWLIFHLVAALIVDSVDVEITICKTLPYSFIDFVKMAGYTLQVLYGFNLNLIILLFGAAYLATKILNFDLATHHGMWQEFRITPSICQGFTSAELCQNCMKRFCAVLKFVKAYRKVRKKKLKGNAGLRSRIMLLQLMTKVPRVMGLLLLLINKESLANKRLLLQIVYYSFRICPMKPESVKMSQLLFEQYPGFKEVRMIAAKPRIAFIEYEDKVH
ncbi:hypothetical protein IFM89_031475 [Coptis chinensis]|uniref:C3H1-type domain-containing protein n=1 Tax=Coptis chinensis TaxID=261450 RepID=A0A835LNB5_9MAGN|nr:hypothetical protein IFM89_031475 [Coptis chinensis]